MSLLPDVSIYNQANGDYLVRANNKTAELWMREFIIGWPPTNVYEIRKCKIEALKSVLVDQDFTVEEQP